MADNKNITLAQLREFATQADGRLDTLEAQAKKSVLHAEQALTEDEQSQARTNIGAEAAFDVLPVAKGGTGATTAAAARTNLGAAPAYAYGTADLTASSSALTTGKMHLVYE